MSTFICEKCGVIDNSACNNNYWRACGNFGKKKESIYQDEYFDNHLACSFCCDGLLYKDGTIAHQRDSMDIEHPHHWTLAGKKQILQWAGRQGCYVNGKEVMKNMTDEKLMNELKIFLARDCENDKFDFKSTEDMEKYISLNEFSVEIADFVRKRFSNLLRFDEPFDESNPLYTHYLQYGDIIYDKEMDKYYMFEGYCVTDTEKAKDIPSIMTIPLFKDKSLRFNMGHVIIPYLRIINHIMTDGSYRFELSSEKPVCIYESFKKIVRVEEFEEYITKHQDKTKKEEV